MRQYNTAFCNNSMFGTRVINYHRKKFWTTWICSGENMECVLPHFNGIASLRRVRCRLKMQNSAEWSGRPGTTKVANENIVWVAAILKDNHCASYKMIEESTGYQKPCSPHSVWWFEKTKTVRTICAACLDRRTTGTACCSAKRLNHPPYSPDLNPPDFFAFLKLKMKLKRD